MLYQSLPYYTFDCQETRANDGTCMTKKRKETALEWEASKVGMRPWGQREQSGTYCEVLTSLAMFWRSTSNASPPHFASPRAGLGEKVWPCNTGDSRANMSHLPLGTSWHFTPVGQRMHLTCSPHFATLCQTLVFNLLLPVNRHIWPGNTSWSARTPHTTTDPSSLVAANAPYVPQTWQTPDARVATYLYVELPRWHSGMQMPPSVLRWQSQGSKDFVQTGLDTTLAGPLKFLDLCLPQPVLVAAGFHIPSAFHPSLCGPS